MAIRQLGKHKFQLIADYYDEDGNRRKHTRTVTCKGKKEARDLLTEFEEMWRDAPPTDLTVSQLVNDYIENREIKGVKATTIHGYKNLKVRIDSSFGRLSASDLTTYQIERYIVRWMKEDKLSAKSVKNTVSLLHAAYKMAIRSGITKTNPCDNVELPKLTRPEIRTLSEEEIQLFMSALEEDTLDFKVMCELALFCGMRRSEILGLTIRDVDVFTSTIRIEHVRVRVGKKDVVQTPKTDRSRRHLACPRFIMDDIVALIQEHDKISNCEYIIQYVGEPMRPDYASMYMERFMIKHDLPHVTLHGLRHTFATMLNASGDFDLADISSALGHSNITTTMNIYVDVFGGAARSSKRISDSFEKKYGKNGAKNGAKAKEKTAEA